MSAPDRDPFALGGADPLIAQGVKRSRLVAQINAPGQVDDVSDAENDELDRIDDQIEVLVPISPEGAVVLVCFLQYRLSGFSGVRATSESPTT